MNKTAIVYTSAEDTAAAARDLCVQITKAFDGDSPDAIVLFASPRYVHVELLTHLQATCKPKILVGASSAVELTSATQGQGLACALALRSSRPTCRHARSRRAPAATASFTRPRITSRSPRSCRRPRPPEARTVGPMTTLTPLRGGGDNFSDTGCSSQPRGAGRRCMVGASKRRAN